ncbi:phosphatase PAP2 family protein [bacterium]|nr:phosphatase PAP2 family protein [bacterium]
MSLGEEGRAPIAEEQEQHGMGPQGLRFNRPLVWLLIMAISSAIFWTWLPLQARQFFWQSVLNYRLLVSMLLGFSLITISLLWSVGQRIDAWAFLFLNLRGHRPLWLDRFMWGFTQLGNSLTTLVLALIVFLSGTRLLSYALILGTLTLWLVVELIKFLVHRRRPFLRLTQTRVIGPREGGRSFPSGHTSQIFFVVTLLANSIQPGIATVVALYAIAVVVGFTRMYVGVHYPRDVLAGMVLGSTWGILGGIVLGVPFLAD